jgi:hypothetical protein
LYYLKFNFYTIIPVPTILKCVYLNSLLVTAILRPQKWKRPRKLKFWIIFHCLKLHTICGSYHKRTQENVIILEVTMYGIKVHPYGHKNTCPFYTVLTFSQKNDSGLVNNKNPRVVFVKSSGS